MLFTMEEGLYIYNSLENICRKNSNCLNRFQYLLSKNPQAWSIHDWKTLLSELSLQLLDPELTCLIADNFRGLLLDLLERTTLYEAENKKEKLYSHELITVALGRLVQAHPDALKFAKKYFSNNLPPFQRLVNKNGSVEDFGDEPLPKKQKRIMKKKLEVSDLQIVVACYWLLTMSCDYFQQCWDWSEFLSYLQHKQEEVRWVACQCIATVLRMSDHQRQTLVMKHVSNVGAYSFILQYQKKDAQVSEVTEQHFNSLEGLCSLEPGVSSTHESQIGLYLSKNVVLVSGVLLPVLDAEDKTCRSCLVPVPSTLANLHSLSLAVAGQMPILLQGPVGCGKTTLVQHLAQVTGRFKFPHLLKVQLGDQTDSKVLLGTYRCTDVPGEFVWQPGALTQAVSSGSWIILEDIDYAPVDVISILVPLLEAGTLMVPGHGDVVRAAPGFQLFVTQRLLGGTVGLHKQQMGHTDLLEKLWTKINVEPLSGSELKQLIELQFPKLRTIADKILEVYFMLSAGKHETALDIVGLIPEESSTAGKFLSQEGRLISTRDLIKWCNRMNTLDVSSSNTASQIFQDAVDCFCCSIMKPDDRIFLIEAISAKLGILKGKVDFYCSAYKPPVSLTTDDLTVGRARLPRLRENVAQLRRNPKATFSFTRQSAVLLERIAVSVQNKEPVLLIGETGTGKTSTVQYLAQQTGHHLVIINMNQQSDSTDLLGGYKPVEVKHIIAPVREKFEDLFCRTFSRKQNVTFLSHIMACFNSRRWYDLFKLMLHTQQVAIKRCKDFRRNDLRSESSKNSHTKPCNTELLYLWKNMGFHIHQLRSQVKHAESALAFSFVEGSLVKALKKGDWVLLDEINLATADTLECLSGLLESNTGSIYLLERGDKEPIRRNPEFHLFACMNPGTDVGKKNLPPGIRNRFTEFYVDELTDSQDLKILVGDYLKALSISASQLVGIVHFYLDIKNKAVKKLSDGTGHKPNYSLRTLCRALSVSMLNLYGSVPRSLFEGFCLSFLTQLDRSSHPEVIQLIEKYVVGKKNAKSILKQPIPEPTNGRYVNVEGYWISRGDMEPKIPEKYILTPLVRQNLRDLVRVVSAGKHPVLLQGETSVGKTSLIMYLAAVSGNRCLRVNNHEHTDLQEYVGSYTADDNGKLVFREGVLVDAMRKGHWIILDELNLAPTDVLEALNRVLDDNRELFIPETQETVQAHTRFMLFATQNPPGFYGGRKVLSRAFRNRFIELHFDEIPPGQLETILQQRCDMPLSYCKKLVAVLLDLQKHRRGSAAFAGKQGFITLRDLFRWAERYRLANEQTAKFYDWDQHIADEGYLVLAGRVRKPEECTIIQEVLEKHMKRRVDPERLFTLNKDTSTVTRPILELILQTKVEEFRHIVWTYSMRKLVVLVGQALWFQEPVLLVGDTGCGKTTVCQMLARLAGRQLFTVNCHMHTEGADFLGGLRPVRQHSGDENSQKLFEWVDGPLVMAMRNGDIFLADEISLADDSVLERLNSVLEPERTLLLAEKASGDGYGDDLTSIVAEEGFRFVGTMNPGGDFGKKELSPALRNRFTEIWCSPRREREDMVKIIEHNLKEMISLCNQEGGTSSIGDAIMDFEWFINSDLSRRFTASIRDILSWVHFINTCTVTQKLEQKMVESTGDVAAYGRLDTASAYIHGACLVFLDSLGSGFTSAGRLANSQTMRSLSLKFLVAQIEKLAGYTPDVSVIMGNKVPLSVTSTESLFGIKPFLIEKGPQSDTSLTKIFTLGAPETAANAVRILRGLQLNKPILLEGSPGVGKTSLVAALAKAAGFHIVRINLSEQTDVSDLFGADLPVEGGKGGHFAWRDGPLLQALKAGHWIVLDELNLASQSVLEGLNACLDHRGEVYVPELGKTFHVQHQKTRLFACQNPMRQGGARKGLPRSFLNRFTQVFIEPLSSADLEFITVTMYPEIPAKLISLMVKFNFQLVQEVLELTLWGQKGGPWELNLRDLFRWCQVMIYNQRQGDSSESDSVATMWNPGEFVRLIYSDRMRTKSDKEKVLDVYREVFGNEYPLYKTIHHNHVMMEMVQVGHSFLARNIEADYSEDRTGEEEFTLLHQQMGTLESLMKCLEMNWMSVLVGPHATGKTSVVKLLSQLTGHRLEILTMNSAMDTTELLGGFEQSS